MPTIAEIVTSSVAETGEFSLLLRALEATNLTGAVADPNADITVFAPTDAAFFELARSLGIEVEDGDEDAVFDGLVAALSGLGDPVALLSEVLLYHVSPGAQSLHELRDAGHVATAQNVGAALGIEGESLVDEDPEARNPRFVEGLTDIAADNGTVHVVDGVLLPLDVPQAPLAETIADLVVATSGEAGLDGQGGDFDILREALVATDLLGAVADPEADLTVFAPTDQAFVDLARSFGADIADGDDAAALDAILATLTTLAGDETAALALLKDVLLNHVAPGARAIENLQGEVTTLLGTTLTVNGNSIADGDPSLTDPSFIDGASNLVTGNGIVQAIDFVLLPIDVAEARDPLADEILVGTVAGESIFGSGGDDEIDGRRGDDTVDGGAGHDRVFGGSGDDIVIAGTGDDRLGGNGGHDEAVFSGSVSDYEISRVSHNLFQVSDQRENGDGEDLVGGIESYSFADGALNLASLEMLDVGEVLSTDDALEQLVGGPRDVADPSAPEMAAAPPAMNTAAMVASDDAAVV